MFLVLVLIAFGVIMWSLLERKVQLSRELGRFRAEQIDVVSQFGKQFNLILAAFGTRKEKKNSLSYQAAKAERDMSAKLSAAGLESPIEQGRFFFLRALCAMVGPLVGISSYAFIPTYYGTLFTLFMSASGIVIPMLWLQLKIKNRNEEIQRELPLVLDLTNLGTSAGWDVAASLEKVIDTLHKEFRDHALMKELKRARWLTASGYTWNEALERVSKRLSNESVRRTTLALGQAMKQGGDRTSQLEGIAEDAQRQYYSELDRRLAALPVKVLLITLVLMMGYFVLVLCPAAVQVKRILIG